MEDFALLDTGEGPLGHKHQILNFLTDFEVGNPEPELIDDSLDQPGALDLRHKSEHLDQLHVLDILNYSLILIFEQFDETCLDVVLEAGTADGCVEADGDGATDVGEDGHG